MGMSGLVSPDIFNLPVHTEIIMAGICRNFGRFCIFDFQT